MSSPNLESHALLRKRLREQRLALSAHARISAAAGLAAQLLPLLESQPSGYIAGYWAVGGELPLHALIPHLSPDHIYCLPLLHPDRCLRFSPWRTGDPIGLNLHGIPEPRSVNLPSLLPGQMQTVLVPLLGFDRRGNRIGMGAGWYDRSFEFRKHQPDPPLLIGVGYAFQECDDIVAAGWDVPLDLIATECELINCR